MSHSAPLEIDCKSPPFDQFRSIHRLASARSGHAAEEHARHRLYVARDKRSRANVLIKVIAKPGVRDKRTRANVLIKVIAKPGVVYEHDLTNEIASLSTINRELPDSRYFPVLGEHGRLSDGRAYLAMSCFDEWPLATAVVVERTPARQVAHLRVAFEVANALIELHGLKIWHVDLNPMNILCRWERGHPVIRIVDFESSYEVARHARGVSYNPPTTTGYSAPELSRRAPDARSDVFSWGAVLYTMLAGYEWTLAGDVRGAVDADSAIAPGLREILLTAVDADPDRRYASSAELRDALAEYLEHAWRRHSI